MKLKLLSYDEIEEIKTFKKKKVIKKSVKNILKQEPFNKIPFLISKHFNHAWDLVNLNIGPNVTIAEISHETAHWIISNRRDLIDFGLGQGFSSSKGIIPVLDSDTCDLEEKTSCYLEWCFMRHFGSTEREISWILDHESFEDFDEDDYKQVIKFLKKIKKSKFEKLDIILEGL